MGFKNLIAFSYAMLSKQAWSLMTKPGNLVTRFYQTKYFPKCDFLDSDMRVGAFGAQNLWCEMGINGVLDRERAFRFRGKSGYMIALRWTILS